MTQFQLNRIANYIILFLSICSNTLSFSQNCDTLTNSRENLGIYGGISTDLTYSSSNNRLFSAMASPASLFFTDDTGKTWSFAYPYDSLEYNCGHQGWGGGCLNVKTNNVGWIIAHNYESAGSLSAVTLNYNEGNPDDWFTLFDPYILQNMGYPSKTIHSIALSDYYAYASYGYYLIMKDRNTSLSITNAINGIALSDTFIIAAIAPTNNSNGFPVYLSIDTTSTEKAKAEGQFLYKSDGLNYSIITMPNYIKSIKKIYTHPNGITGDTLFMLGYDDINMGVILRSFDGGNSWSNIFFGANYFEVDYSANWKTAFSQSEGILLIIPGLAISTDLGSTFTFLTNKANLLDLSMAVQPNSNFVIACMDPAEIVFGTNFTSGSFSANENLGLESIQVNKIARSANKEAFYLATYAGLAYTTAYSDTSINNYDKWNPPNGEFPVTNCDGEYTALAMDPNDSLHVIAGFNQLGTLSGFSITSTGPSGFSTVSPTFDMEDKRFGDIEFINSNNILCVTRGGLTANAGTGNIWRSTDGGNNWTKVSPSGFSSGNCISVYFGNTDTVIYVGTGSDGYDPGRLWKSIDLGLTWQEINSGPYDILDPSIDSLPINDIVVDPRSADTLYIAAGYLESHANSPQAFVKSTDGGLSYEYINISGDAEFMAIEIDPTNPDSGIYVTNQKRIFSYNSITDTTELLYKGMPGEVFSDIAIGSILVGTTTGFYSLPIEESGDTLYTKIYKEFKQGSVLLYPNPALETCHLEVELKSSCFANIEIRDLSGRIVQIIYSDQLSEGKNVFRFSVKSLDAGLYLVSMNTEIEKQCLLLSVKR